MAINPQMQDKYLALFASMAAIAAYMVTVWMGHPDEFLKNVALLFAGAFAALLKTGATIDASPKTGDTNITTTKND
jgi:hypothetical protein